MKRKSIVFFIILLIAFASKAQTYTGCILQGSSIPTSRLFYSPASGTSLCGGSNYSFSTYVDVPPGCSWVATTSTTPCSVASGLCGLRATYTNSCSLPLDKLSTVLVLIAAGFAFYLLRYKRLAI
ncbi:hypothetical protein [Pedobacter sp. ASV12]|uniref:hypothetical protein n=1 Tax=Pedobacter sp. ASV12 TaxID=2795120 RepID=UPI0018ECDB55|nr:hypothetical protein [Pedobacter sp. ASV12]